MIKKPSIESEVSHKFAKLLKQSEGNNKENVITNHKKFKVKPMAENTSIKDLAKLSEEGLHVMKEEMRASHFEILNNFIVNYYLSQGEIMYPSGWKPHYRRTVVRGIIRYAVNYDIDESQVISTIIQFVALHGLHVDEEEIKQFILLNSS